MSSEFSEAHLISSNHYLYCKLRFGKKLEGLAKSSTPPPVWYTHWLNLTEQSSAEERLVVWKMIRASGDLPAEVGFHLVTSECVMVTQLHILQLLNEVEKRADAIYEECGLDAWHASFERDSDHYESFQEQCPDDWDRLFVNTLIEHGEQEIAKVYRTERDRYWQLWKTGQDYLCPVASNPTQGSTGPGEGTAAPSWLVEFSGKVVQEACLDLLRQSRVPVSVKLVPYSDGWGVLVYPSVVEMVGGDRDGEIVHLVFVLDLRRLRRLFDKVTRFLWDPFDYQSHPEASHVKIVGTYQGQTVMVKVFALPEEGQAPEAPVEGSE
jgi:hypothetical protein